MDRDRHRGREMIRKAKRRKSKNKHRRERETAWEKTWETVLTNCWLFLFPVTSSLPLLLFPLPLYCPLTFLFLALFPFPFFFCSFPVYLLYPFLLINLSHSFPLFFSCPFPFIFLSLSPFPFHLFLLLLFPFSFFLRFLLCLTINFSSPLLSFPSSHLPFHLSLSWPFFFVFPAISSVPFLLFPLFLSCPSSLCLLFPFISFSLALSSLSPFYPRVTFRKGEGEL